RGTRPNYPSLSRGGGAGMRFVAPNRRTRGRPRCRRSPYSLESSRRLSSRPAPSSGRDTEAAMPRPRTTIVSLVRAFMALIAAGCGGPAIGAQEIPPPLAPFEYLVGSWKGRGVATADRVKGWPETHAWAWKFAKGQPIGLTLAFQGNKTLKDGEFTYDPDGRV